MSTTEGKGRQEETIEIKKNIVIDASPEVVFKAITDPNELTNWFPDQAILEPKVGGKMKFSFYKKKSVEHKGDPNTFFPEL
ncbi:MAG: SRPBCC domain-containing protein [Thermoproteota archaeon]|nr:SRPBCC domain-containing protein [Thermoproteota archaeon]